MNWYKLRCIIFTVIYTNQIMVREGNTEIKEKNDETNPRGQYNLLYLVEKVM